MLYKTFNYFFEIQGYTNQGSLKFDFIGQKKFFFNQVTDTKAQRRHIKTEKGKSKLRRT